MKTYHASRTTIRNALQLLRDDGLIESKRGYGTIVHRKNQPVYSQASQVTYIDDAVFHYTAGHSDNEKISEAIVDIVPAGTEAANALQLPVGENVFRMRWLLSVDNITCRYMTILIFKSLVPDLDQRLKKELSKNVFPLYDFLQKEYGLTFTDAKEQVDPICANFVDARFLEVEIGKPLFKLSRISYSGDTPLEYSITVVNPDIVNLSLKIKPYQT